MGAYNLERQGGAKPTIEQGKGGGKEDIELSGTDMSYMSDLSDASVLNAGVSERTMYR